MAPLKSSDRVSWFGVQKGCSPWPAAVFARSRLQPTLLDWACLGPALQAPGWDKDTGAESVTVSVLCLSCCVETSSLSHLRNYAKRKIIQKAFHWPPLRKHLPSARPCANRHYILNRMLDGTICPVPILAIGMQSWGKEALSIPRLQESSQQLRPDTSLGTLRTQDSCLLLCAQQAACWTFAASQVRRDKSVVSNVLLLPPVTSGSESKKEELWPHTVEGKC